MNEINLQEIKEKLYEKVKASGWGPMFVNLIMSSDFDVILKTLEQEARNGKRFTPQIKNLFRAFEECPYDNTRVVFIGMDPYPGLGIADGIAFSCSNLNKIEKSLEVMYKSISETTGIVCTNPDLKPWANQGMLMLNSALTVTIGKPGTHCELWKPFITYILDYLATKKDQLCYVFLGKRAQEYYDLVPDTNKKIIATHPASAAYSGSYWNCKDLWNEINQHLISKNEKEINYSG
jgi:uracil-DNA glycosylase